MPCTYSTPRQSPRIGSSFPSFRDPFSTTLIYSTLPPQPPDHTVETEKRPLLLEVQILHDPFLPVHPRSVSRTDET